MKLMKIKIVGLAPLLMHNPTAANPLDPKTVFHKKLTSKRKKTEEDHLAIMESEWKMALYFSDRLGVYIPGQNVEASLLSAAKMQKLGTKVKRALLVTEDEIKIEYKGPKTVEGLYADKSFVDVRLVKVQAARLMRTRPRFNDWSAKFTIQFNPEQLDESDVLKMVHDAGSLVGIGDYRPRFGKFTAEVLHE